MSGCSTAGETEGSFESALLSVRRIELCVAASPTLITACFATPSASSKNAEARWTTENCW